MNNTISHNGNLTSLISYPSPGLRASGTYTEVHQGELKGSGKRRLVAIKSYKPMSNEKIRSEIEVLSGIPHHNIVPFLGFKDDGPSISIVMPWMSDGTLTSFIRTHGEVIETAMKSTLLHDIASGLQHLHSNFVVHGNLESDNVLINEQHRACLSGFRQSVKLPSREAECPRSQMPRKPAIQFAGPEWFVRNDKRFQPLSQTLFKSDVYSLGCVMFYTFTKCMPWHDATSTDISDKLRQCVTPPRPKGLVIDDRQWTLIKPCLSFLPQHRPSTSHLLKDIEGYFVSVGPRDLSGQIQLSRPGAGSHGGYGTVYEGIWSRKAGGNIKVAIKVLHIRDRSPMELKKIEEILKRELAAWRRLSHPNILSLLGTATDIGQDGIKSMVSLWMDNGSLEQYMKVKSGVLTPSQRLHWVKDVAGGLKYLHDYPIVHGDLTPANVLIDNEERAVLTDFGLSIILGGFPDVSCAYTDGKTGTVICAAPELFIDGKFLNRDVQSPSPKPASDVYSFACLMYMIFSGKQPWVVRGPAELGKFINNLQNGERPSNPGNVIEARYWGLIVQCWSSAPDSRPVISDVLKRL